jgi:hypothetical protein
MNEEVLRAMIRESVARHLGGPGVAGPTHPAPTTDRLLPFSAHASHFRYTLPESGGPCYVEPGVRCNHCGYCQSHGH